jgi:RHS repeat-associated protein
VQSITGTGALNLRFPARWFQCRAFRPAPRSGVGRRHQNETGLHYNWHRSYDPTIGRYTQPDPLGFVDGPSVYGYAKHSPLIAIDYDGLFTSIPNPSPGSSVQQCNIIKECAKRFGKNLKLSIIQCMMLITGEDGPPPPPPTPPPITRPGPPPPPPPTPPSPPPRPPTPPKL